MLTKSEARERTQTDIQIARALKDLRGRLHRWGQELRGHHAAIANRNYCVGREVMLFLEQYPPKQYHGYNLLGEAAKAVGFTPEYLRFLIAITSWLETKGIQSAGQLQQWMNTQKITNWSRLTTAYFEERIRRAGRDKRKVLNRRYGIAAEKLEFFKEALPEEARPMVDRFLGRMHKMVIELIGE